MPTRVRSFSKINLGLAIGAPRPDGFHSLSTLYQTIALHDLLTVAAKPAAATRITLASNDPRVPLDGRNTAWKMVERVLAECGVTAEVHIHIQKNLPIQGGMGAGSANAAAALLGLERELSLSLALERRLAVAAQVGSDVPLFLIGGSVLGLDRGQVVEAVADVTLHGQTQIPCVIALPSLGVSTPQAFREWDRRFEAVAGQDLHSAPIRDTLNQLRRTYASVLLESSGPYASKASERRSEADASSTLPDTSPATPWRQEKPENQQAVSSEQTHDHQMRPATTGSDTSHLVQDQAGNTLLALVDAGIQNDFESVVFPQHPLLGEIKRLLTGSSADSTHNASSQAGDTGQAVYAALSGSGSALFGLYRSQIEASAAQQRLQQHGVQAIVTSTLPRPLYWSNMFAE
jgi:4-diphosphocytidyl-2-C-methyl-D-erythritol kinase